MEPFIKQKFDAVKRYGFTIESVYLYLYHTIALMTMFACTTPKSIAVENTVVAMGSGSGAAGAAGAVTLNLSVMHDSRDTCMVEIVPPESGESPCLDICIVMDVSGSMGDAANPNGPEGINQFTKLDLAKRGTEVMIHALRERDTLSLVSFSSEVQNVLPRTPMHAAGRQNALQALNRLRPGGGTALWDGLYAGLYQTEVAPTSMALGAGDPVGAHRIPVVILLTDGQPSFSPPSGEGEELRKYVQARSLAQPTVGAVGRSNATRNAKLILMGFGYDVNSKLLSDLTSVHHVSDAYCFIPDGTMLLTTFTNLMANLMSICARQVVLTLPVRLADQMDILGGDSTTVDRSSHNTHVVISLGDVLYGQARQIVLRCKPGVSLDTIPILNTNAAGLNDIHLAYVPIRGMAIARQSLAMLGPNSILSDPSTVAYHRHRAVALTALQQALRIANTDLDTALGFIKKCALDTTNMDMHAHPIVEDLMGEVASALCTKDAWTRWGAHYLRALVCAHKAQTCTNFKDPGLAAYGGPFTKQLKETYNALCDGLPVPVPSLQPRDMQWGVPVGGAGSASGAGGIPVISATVFQQAFNNQYGGCVAHGTFIRTGDNREVPVQSLCKGDTVVVPGRLSGEPSRIARVRCIVASKGVKTVPLKMTADYPYPMPLGITPWHPVRMPDGTWRFPADLVSDTTLQEPYEGAVYTLVLDEGHVVLANGIPILTLGHGFQEHKAKHDFYGTQAVIDALSILDGWEQGWVMLGNRGEPVKDDTGKMIGFVPAYV